MHLKFREALRPGGVIFGVVSIQIFFKFMRLDGITMGVRREKARGIGVLRCGGWEAGKELTREIE